MKGKVDSFLAFKGQFNEDLQIVHEKLTNVKKVLKANIKSKKNPHGLLTRPEQAYLDCLDLNVSQLESLFS